MYIKGQLCAFYDSLQELAPKVAGFDYGTFNQFAFHDVYKT